MEMALLAALIGIATSAGVLLLAMFGILSLIAAYFLHLLAFEVAVFDTAYLSRVLLSITCGWRVVGDRQCLRCCWLYPLHTT
jgi:hypothetical protein